MNQTKLLEMKSSKSLKKKASVESLINGLDQAEEKLSGFEDKVN
jgi:hypothetical protein